MTTAEHIADLADRLQRERDEALADVERLKIDHAKNAQHHIERDELLDAKTLEVERLQGRERDLLFEVRGLHGALRKETTEVKRLRKDRNRLATLAQEVVLELLAWADPQVGQRVMETAAYEEFKAALPDTPALPSEEN
jgi:hypothetical protein